MIQSKKFALAYRLGALLFAVIGVMKQVGIFSGKIGSGSFMYYTIQSNLLVIVLFTMLVIRTVKSLKKDTQGYVGWYARFEMVCVVNILLTLVVFWIMLAPQVSKGYLFTFENISVHTVTPLLCLGDYLLFTKGRHLKYKDVYYTSLFPLFYFIFTMVASVSGYVYNQETITENRLNSAVEITPVRVPYFFLDYEKIGAMVIVYVLALFIFIILMGHLFYFIDRKVRKQT